MTGNGDAELADLLCRWESPEFESRLRDILEKESVNVLGIERATTHGGRVAHEDVSISILALAEAGGAREVRIGVFFTEAVGGCNCADDPFMVNGYCERRVVLDLSSGTLRIDDTD